MINEVEIMDAMKRANPSQFSRPRIPATAPAKQEERNLTEFNA
jgi:hypothetical protein